MRTWRLLEYVFWGGARAAKFDNLFDIDAYSDLLLCPQRIYPPLNFDLDCILDSNAAYILPGESWEERGNTDLLEGSYQDKSDQDGPFFLQKRQ